MTSSSSYLQAFHHVGGGTAPTMGVPPLELTAGLGQLLWQQQQHSDYAEQVSRGTGALLDWTYMVWLIGT